jgi:hypothetical protein
LPNELEDDGLIARDFAKKIAELTPDLTTRLQRAIKNSVEKKKEG